MTVGCSCVRLCLPLCSGGARCLDPRPIRTVPGYRLLHMLALLFLWSWMSLSRYLMAWREQGSQFTLGRKGKPCGGSLDMDLGGRRVSGGAVGGLAAPLH